MADEHGQHVMDAAMAVAGARSMLAGAGPTAGGPTAGGVMGQPGEPAGAAWPESMWGMGYLFARALTIGGGTSEVQRNIVAERVLGLPHDVDVESGNTWAQSQGATLRANA